MKQGIFIFLVSFFCTALVVLSGTNSVPKIQNPKGGDTNDAISDSIAIKFGKTAEFPGGDVAFIEYITDNFNYPARCHEEGIGGYVLLRFVINQLGRISDIEVIEEVKACPEFALEAIRVLKTSPTWTPGVYKGKPAKIWKHLPIRLNVE